MEQRMTEEEFVKAQMVALCDKVAKTKGVYKNGNFAFAVLVKSNGVSVIRSPNWNGKGDFISESLVWLVRGET